MLYLTWRVCSEKGVWVGFRAEYTHCASVHVCCYRVFNHFKDMEEMDSIITCFHILMVCPCPKTKMTVLCPHSEWLHEHICYTQHNMFSNDHNTIVWIKPNYDKMAPQEHWHQLSYHHHAHLSKFKSSID